MKKTVKKRFRVAFWRRSSRQTLCSFIDAYDVAQLLAKYKYVIVNGGGQGNVGFNLRRCFGRRSVKRWSLVPNTSRPNIIEGQSEANLAAAKKSILSSLIRADSQTYSFS